MRKYYSDRLLMWRRCFFLATGVLMSIHGISQVSLTATSGTATGTYTTLSAAFTAINAGTHFGDVDITITANTTEPISPTPLNTPLTSNGYTKVTIVPQGNRIVGLTSLNTNRGIVEFLAAKNVTIDGDDPSTAGDKNLTFQFNTGTSSFNNTAVFKLMSSSNVLFCQNIVIKNCKIVGPKPSATSTSISYGIAICGNGTLGFPPTAGVRNNGITIENNEIIRAFHGIYCEGNTSDTLSFHNIKILKNKIGATSVVSDYIGSIGINLLGSSRANSSSVIEQNEIKANTNATSGYTAPMGGIRILNGNPSLAIKYNHIREIVNNHPSSSTTLSGTSNQVFGILVNGVLNTNIDINNNIIRDVISARKQSSLGGEANYGIYLLDFGSARISHNTIGLQLPNTQGTGTNTVSASVFVVNGNLIDMSNNIMTNINSSTNAFCIITTTPTIANTTINKNCYYFPNGSLGNTSAPNNLANWQSITGKDQLSFVENPPFVNPANDLHLISGSITRLESNAQVSGYVFDIDLENRVVPTDIGADDFAGTAYTAPSILSVFHTPTTQSCATATARTVQVLFSTLGNATDSVMVEYSYGGGANNYLKMNSVSALGFTRLIPIPSPLNLTVRYRVFAVTKVGDTVSSNYYYYNDNSASRALIPTLSSTPTATCANSAVDLEYKYLPDPTGFIFPPNVIDTSVRTNITSVKLGTIDNTSPDTNSLIGTIGVATGSKGAYANYRNFTTATVGLGKSYDVSISGATISNTKLYFAAFVDFNGDGSFTGTNEMVFNTVQARTTGNRTEKFSLYIPPDARPGKTCIRFYCSQAPITSVNNDIFRGEIEDYSIQITPYAIEWFTGATSIGSNNPQSYTPTTVPVNVYIKIVDSSGCDVTSNLYNIPSSTGSLNVTLTAPSSGCYNTPVLVRANVTGGCPPYTYAWSNGGPNSATQMVTLLDANLDLTITVTDKNGSQYSATGTINKYNPRLTGWPDTVRICNRGSKPITVSTSGTDSAYWYSAATDPPFGQMYIGKTFTTPLLNFTTNYYVSAVRSSADSTGKFDQTGINITTPIIPLSGHLLDVKEPVIIRNCWMYITGTTTSTINVGLLDKYGTIIAQTGNFVPAFSGNINNPTLIPLNFVIDQADTSYKLILLAQNGLTGLRRHTSGYTYPLGATKPVTVRKAYSITSPTLNDYFYFYNIRLQKNLCVGQKERTTAKVAPPVVPNLIQDLKYTLLCKGDTLRIGVKTGDTIGNRFVWFKNGNVIQDLTTSPPSDTMRDSFYTVAISGSSDTGLYKVEIHSSYECTRDTFSREVRVSFHPEPEFLTNLNPVDICLKRNTTLSAITKNAHIFKWYKDTFNYLTSDTSKVEYTITNGDFVHTGKYHVVATDSNRCRDVKSNIVQVTVHDTPYFKTHPMDTVVCEGQRHVIRTEPIHAITYQWFKSNGILNGFVKDSMTLYSATLQDSGEYKLIATSYPGCPEAISNAGFITVNPKPQILGFYPSEMKFCESQKMKLESNYLNAQRVDWYKGSSFVGSFDSIVKMNTVITDSGKYSFKIIGLNKCPSINSDTIQVKVYRKPQITGTRPTHTACAETDFRFGFPSTSTKIYQWYRNGIAVQGQTDSQLYIQVLSDLDNGTYYLMANSDAVCPEARSNSFIIDVKPKPKITLHPQDIVACMGEDISLNSTIENGSTLQWFKDGNIIPAATLNTLAINNVSGSSSGKYWLRVNGMAPCTFVTSDTAEVIHRSGQTNAVVSLVSVYNTEEQCTDDENWTYYATKEDPNKYLFAVRKNGNNIVGKADIVVRPSTFQHVNNSGSEYTATIMLKRYWNYKLESGNITTPIDVKFYVDPNEINLLETKKDDIMNLYANELVQENTDMLWFKTKDIPFNNTALMGIRGNQFNFDSLIIQDVVEGTENGVKFFTFQNIDNIGGGSAFYRFKGNPRYLSIQNAQNGMAASIYPNPNEGKFNLSVLAKKVGMMHMTVVNHLGQTVYTSDYRLTSSTMDFDIDIPNLSNGIYQIILTQDDFSSQLKLQIDR